MAIDRCRKSLNQGQRPAQRRRAHNQTANLPEQLFSPRWDGRGLGCGRASTTIAKLSAKVPSLGAIRTSPCTSWETPPSGGCTSWMMSFSETAKTPSLIPSVRSVRYFRPVFSLSSFDEPSPLMKFSRQLPFGPAVGAGQRIAFALPG